MSWYTVLSYCKDLSFEAYLSSIMISGIMLIEAVISNSNRVVKVVTISHLRVKLL